jgi:hypothetical protein
MMCKKDSRGAAGMKGLWPQVPLAAALNEECLKQQATPAMLGSSWERELGPEILVWTRSEVGSASIFFDTQVYQ